MNWKDSPEQSAFREEVRAFIRARFPVDYTPNTEGEQSLEPEDVWGYNWIVDIREGSPKRRGAARQWADALAERGWTAPHWPTEYGGAGLGPHEEFILQEEMMRAGVPQVNGIAVNLLGPTLLAHGTEEQKRAHLPKIASGEVIWAQGFSEPGAGSDLASLRTRAVRDHNQYVVNGQKVWTSLGQYADWLFILVRTDSKGRKHRGITFLLVDVNTPGVSIRPIADIRRAQPFAEIFFEDARVPVTNRVGDENRGWYVAMSTLAFERSGIGATIKYERAVRDLVQYVRSEEARRYLRDDWRSLRHEIARRWVETRVLYNLARYTVSIQASGDVPGYEASANQLFSAELHQRLARTGAKLFGEYSKLWQREGAPLDAAFSHLTLDSVAATFLAGTSEIQRNVIATRGLGLPRE
ncbi:MAG: acyl-CoA dehydrogenase family protein [Nitrospiraceae bacterium]